MVSNSAPGSVRREGKVTQPQALNSRTPVTHIYFIRHAAVENPHHITYGALPGFHIGLRGQKRSARVGKMLKTEGITRIYASPLERTRETAEAIRAELGENIPIQIDSDLTEDGSAIYWQGLPQALLPIRYPHYYLAWLTYPERIRFAESAIHVAARIDRAIERILARHPGESVLVVCHGGPIKAWVTWRQHLSWRRLHLNRVRNAEGYLIEAEKGEILSIKSFQPLS